MITESFQIIKEISFISWYKNFDNHLVSIVTITSPRPRYTAFLFLPFQYDNLSLFELFQNVLSFLLIWSIIFIKVESDEQ